MLRLTSWVALGLLMLFCAALGAQEQPAPSVLVSIVAATGTEAAFRPVLAEAVGYTLRRYSLKVSFRDDLPALSGPAAGADTDFHLNGRYSQTGSQMEISFAWRDQATGLLVAAVERQGRVDLVLDTLILEALNELLAQVEGRIPERLARAPAAPAVTPIAAPPAGTAPAAQPAPGDTPSTTPVNPAVPAPSADLTRLEQASFMLSPSVAPFVAVGAASYYFPVGIQSLVLGDFLLKAGWGRLGLGALLGVTVFKAQGATEDSINFLVPLAASVRYALELGSRWNLLFQLGAGPALLVMGLESQGALAKVLPYVRSGIGAELVLTRGLGLALEAAYEVYFESPYLIMGLVPSLSLTWRM